MLMNYEECIKKYHDELGIKKAIESKNLFKLEKGVYSDKEYVNEVEIVIFKYPKGVVTLDSALYYLDYTDVIPEKTHLATDKDASKIKDDRVIQVFDNSGMTFLGTERKIIDNIEMLIYDKERLLVEVIRYRFKLPFDFYKEVINNYRKNLDELDFQKLQDYIEQLPKSERVREIIKMEVL